MPAEGPCLPKVTDSWARRDRSVLPAGAGLGHRSRPPPLVCPFCSESSFAGGRGLFKGGEQASVVSEISAWPADEVVFRKG